MKLKLIATVLASTILLAACGAENKTIGGVEYGTYGVVNERDMKNPNIQYEVSGWSVVWSIVLCETVIAPIYFVGWNLYQPLSKKDPNWVPGQVK